MDKKQLKRLLPQTKDDEQRAEWLASLEYDVVKPISYEMLRWLRTAPSPVAAVFLRFFILNGVTAVEDVNKALTTSRQTHLKYVIVTQVLPEWPRRAIELLELPLNLLMTDSGEPETALMSLELLAKHGLREQEGLKGWLNFITDRMERNLGHARRIAVDYF